VEVFLGGGPGRGTLVESLLVDVAQGGHLHDLACLLDVAPPLTADADAGDSQALVRARGASGRRRRTREEVTEGRGPRLKGLATIDALVHVSNSPKKTNPQTGADEKGVYCQGWGSASAYLSTNRLSLFACSFGKALA